MVQEAHFKGPSVGIADPNSEILSQFLVSVSYILLIFLFTVWTCQTIIDLASISGLLRIAKVPILL